MSMVNGGQGTGIRDLRLRHFIVFCLLPSAFCLLLISCASQKVTKPAGNGYFTVLEKWTREGKIYENFETKALMNATYKTQEFRESYVAEYINTFMLDSGKAGRLMKDEMEAPKKYHEFFLAIHTPDRDWSDLDRKEPIWALYLANDTGDIVSPLEIKKLKEKGPGVIRFYPYFTEWSVGYTVKFPYNLPDGRQLITDEARYVKLVMTGTPGRGELVWKIKP